MVTILMMSAKLATLGLLKIKVFKKKVITSLLQSMTSPTKSYHMTNILQM